MRHYHFNPEHNEFQSHSHLHSGPHTHGWEMTKNGPVMVTKKGPGNYAPGKDEDE